MSNSVNKKVRPEVHGRYRHLLRFGPECQSCLSEDEYDGDSLLECYLCNGRIHQACLGPYHCEQEELGGEWYCERCEAIRQAAFEAEPERCHFCPLATGIMRRILYNKQTVWAHPECFMRDYPLKVERSKKCKEAKMPSLEQQRVTQKAILEHWLCRPSETQPCSVCKSSYGETTKCKVPECAYYFHITCGIKEGVVREQASMNVRISDEFNFYIPFYCARHLEEREEDYFQKINSLKFKHRESELAFMAQKIKEQVDNMKAFKTRIIPEDEFSYYNN
jgi:hypothetical protein